MRRVIYWIHLYVGLLLGAAVVFVGLTGSAVVYRPEIERLLNPEWFAVTAGGAARSLEALAESAVKTYPGATPTFVSVQPPLAPDEHVTVMMKHRFGKDSGPWVRAHLDPYDGRIIASFVPEETFSGFLLQLHASLLIGDHTWGEQVVGVFGILVILFCITGLILWWPGLRRLHRGFRVRSRRGPVILNYDLHRVAGIVFMVPLFLAAVTGVVLVFPKYTRAPIVEAFGIERPPRAPKSSGRASRIPVDDVRGIVERRHPSAQLVGLQLPGNPNAAYQARLLLPGEKKIRYGGGAKLIVWIDPATGDILKEHNAKAMPLASRIMFQWIFPTHTGDIAGEAGRLVMFVAGIVPLALFITGVYVWYRRRAGRRRTAMQTQAQVALSPTSTSIR